MQRINLINKQTALGGRRKLNMQKSGQRARYCLLLKPKIPKYRKNEKICKNEYICRDPASVLDTVYF